MSQAPIPELTAVSAGIAKAMEGQPEAWQRLHAMSRWVVYTDGSAPIVNPGGVIGFASVFVLDGGGAFEVHGGVPARTTDPPTSNNRAEIAGAIAILELIYKTHLERLPLPREVEVVCDSQYVVNCAEGRWKKHKNRDLWQRFDQLASVARAQKVKVFYRWTRAHVGTEWNERADVLAKDGAMAMECALPSDAQAVNSKPLEAPAKAASDHHYLLRLFAAMTGKTRSEGYYELRTPSRSRQETVTVQSSITLDEAEYHTLNAALADLLTTLETAGRSPTDFKICVESSRDLMLKQIQGIYGVKSERLIPLHGKTRQLIRQFGGVDWLTGDKNDLKALART
jgi:ribonuclease HI